MEEEQSITAESTQLKNAGFLAWKVNKVQKRAHKQDTDRLLSQRPRQRSVVET